jgi:hypothetical protein
MNSVSFIGFMGSCEVSCVVSSFMKSSAPRACLPAFLFNVRPVMASVGAPLAPVRDGIVISKEENYAQRFSEPGWLDVSGAIEVVAAFVGSGD